MARSRLILLLLCLVVSQHYASAGATTQKRRKTSTSIGIATIDEPATYVDVIHEPESSTTSSSSTNTSPQEEETTESSNDKHDDTSPTADGSLWETYTTVWSLMIVSTALMGVISLYFFCVVNEKDRIQGEYQKRTWNVLKYLNFSSMEDVNVQQSPLGGFNVTYNSTDDVTASNLAVGETTPTSGVGRTSLSHPDGIVPLPDIMKEKQGKEQPSDTFTDEEDEAAAVANVMSMNAHKMNFYFQLFICISQGIRAYESGFTAAMITNIQEDLGLDYTDEGTIAASPDYGLSPGAILAIWTFRNVQVKPVFVFIMFGVALLSGVVATFPTFASLVTTRALNGVLWSHAATFYPIWIDRHGPNKKSRTVWLAWMNVSVLLGVLVGYIIGGAARSSGGRVTWMHLYYVECGLMFLCGVVLWWGFDQDVIRNDGPYRPVALRHADSQAVGMPDDKEEVKHHDDDDGSTATVWELLKSLGHSTPYILSVLITGTIAGAVTFALFFVSQVVEARDLDTREVTMYVVGVFVLAPVPGMLFGSYLVGHLGGYTNHMLAFGMSLLTSVFVLAAAVLFPVSQVVFDKNGSNVLFLLANWIWFFAGSMPGTPLYGVAVSVLPRASLVASALQFAIANLSKVIVPQIGGIVCDRLGLLHGYYSTLMVVSLVFVALSWYGVLYVVKQSQRVSSSSSKVNT